MKCIDTTFFRSHPQDPANFMNFKKFESIPTLTDYILCPMGMSLDVFNCYDNVVLLLYEEPNDFWVPSVEQTVKNNYHKIHKLISNCPYITKYYNDLYGNDKRVCGFNSFNIENIPQDFTKKYDVFFTGHVFHEFITRYVNVIEKFNNCIVSFNYGNFRGIGYHDKLQLNANSKISVVHNCLYNTSDIPMWELHPKHETLRNLKNTKFSPQVKIRTLEAAACKSILLCHFEEYRCIETMFTPNKDFIYWYNNKDLEEKIHEILKNYDKYIYLAENAYEILINNWTTYHFFEKYLKNL